MEVPEISTFDRNVIIGGETAGHESSTRESNIYEPAYIPSYVISSTPSSNIRRACLNQPTGSHTIPPPVINIHRFPGQQQVNEFLESHDIQHPVIETEPRRSSTHSRETTSAVLEAQSETPKRRWWNRIQRRRHEQMEPASITEVQVRKR